MEHQRQRLAEIERLITYRHGGSCDTDDGELYLRAAMPHLVAEPVATRKPIYRGNNLSWAGKWTPRLLDEHGIEWFDDLEDKFGGKDAPKPLRADAIAKELGVTMPNGQTSASRRSVPST